MNLVRLGHYYTPQGEGEKGSCQTALVCGHDEYGGAAPETVNVTVWNHRGEPIGNRENVPVMTLEQIHAPKPGEENRASYHLSSECPWHR